MVKDAAVAILVAAGVPVDMMLYYRTIILLIGAAFITGCSPCSYVLEPCISYIPQEPYIASLPSSFPPQSIKEEKSDWGKELLIGQEFACELDLYRAITAFKRARILLPDDTARMRALQADYGIFLSYYLGGKYEDAVNTFECSDLAEISSHFPAVRELLLALFDSYMHTDHYTKAFRILELIDAMDEDAGIRLRMGDSIIIGDLCAAEGSAECLCDGSEAVDEFFCRYAKEKLSVRKAQVLNAVLPGAGYLYAGQHKAAATSLVINTLFIAAAYQFFQHGMWGAGLITTSLELGWYIGGINGAGLAAKQYNECLYNTYGKEAMVKGRLFPVLLFQTAF